jgi:hypothetical protein
MNNTADTTDPRNDAGPDDASPLDGLDPEPTRNPTAATTAPTEAATGPVTEEGPLDEPALDTTPILEMRQVAGLTAGPVMDLHVGSFQFNESDSDVGFDLTVAESAEVVVRPGTADAHIDEVALTEPTPLNDAVLNVGSACFTVRPPRPAPSAEHRLATLDAVLHRPPAITVPTDLVAESEGATQTRSTRFGALFARGEGEPETGLDHGWWEFLETVRDVRSHVAERHRWLHPDPEELRSRLQRMDPGLWDRGIEHPLFGRVALAYATIPWEPRFDAPERIPTPLHGPIREMSHLPWVPVTANLHHGPLGIAGSRAAVLAAARSVILALASLTVPSDLTLSIVTAKGRVDDWSWTSALPNSLFPNGDDAFLIAIADGMTHFEGAGFEHEAVLRNEMGLVALGESPDDLPEYCGTVLLIGPDGRCQVRNHLGEQVVGTPIGVTADFAVGTAEIIAEAIEGGRMADERRPVTALERSGPIDANELIDEFDRVRDDMVDVDIDLTGDLDWASGPTGDA